jgi:hypothetical protein
MSEIYSPGAGTPHLTRQNDQIRHVEEEPGRMKKDDEQEGARVTRGFSSLLAAPTLFNNKAPTISDRAL